MIKAVVAIAVLFAACRGDEAGDGQRKAACRPEGRSTAALPEQFRQREESPIKFGSKRIKGVDPWFFLNMLAANGVPIDYLHGFSGGPIGEITCFLLKDGMSRQLMARALHVAKGDEAQSFEEAGFDKRPAPERHLLYLANRGVPLDLIEDFRKHHEQDFSLQDIDDWMRSRGVNDIALASARVATLGVMSVGRETLELSRPFLPLHGD